MDRRHFIKQTATMALSGFTSVELINSQSFADSVLFKNKILTKNPRAITMWDFSWLERRWEGAGYEDWDLALDQLSERGYNAVRIDVYPHLLAENPTKEWMLNEVWNQQVWGSPDLNKVQIQPYLNQFLEKCKTRDIKVGISSWYRQDINNTLMKITTPQKMAECWLKTLQSIDKDGLLDNIMYVDLCNEWPGNLWAPFFSSKYPHITWGQWYKEESVEWMKVALMIMREKYPTMPFLFSFDNGDVEKYNEIDTSFLDLYEHHIWMVHQNNSEFYKTIDYKDGRFSPQAYKNVVAYAEELYRKKPQYWQQLLVEKIEKMGEVAKQNKRLVVTTECWGIVDYKDWPLLKWDWVKELCALGTLTAAKTGAWAGIATSNFCGPQFVGMWRDIEWHKQLTSAIRTSPIDQSIIKNNKITGKLLNRM